MSDARIPEITNEDLLILLRQDDEPAFAELYGRYWRKLYSAAYKRIKSAEQAEGIVQDFFTSLWVNRKKLKLNASFEAYAYTAVRYQVLQHIRKEIVRKKYKGFLEVVHVSHHNSTEEAVLLNDLKGSLAEAVTRLPEKCRAVFELSREKNKTNKEIAEELGISEKTVENHLTKALKYLRLSLGEVFFFLLLLFSF